MNDLQTKQHVISLKLRIVGEKIGDLSYSTKEVI